MNYTYLIDRMKARPETKECTFSFNCTIVHLNSLSVRIVGHLLVCFQKNGKIEWGCVLAPHKPDRYKLSQSVLNNNNIK